MEAKADTRQDLKLRTRQFSLRVISLVDSLPRRKSATVIGNQLLRAATSVGANYRAALRGRSRAEFISKLNIALEEADESLYWLELLNEARLAPLPNFTAFWPKPTNSSPFSQHQQKRLAKTGPSR